MRCEKRIGGGGTHGITFDGGVAHAPAEIGVDAQDEGLDEEPAVEGCSLEVDGLGRVVDRGFAGHREACAADG